MSEPSDAPEFFDAEELEGRLRDFNLETKRVLALYKERCGLHERQVQRVDLAQANPATWDRYLQNVQQFRRRRTMPRTFADSNEDTLYLQ